MLHFKFNKNMLAIPNQTRLDTGLVSYVITPLHDNDFDYMHIDDVIPKVKGLRSALSDMFIGKGSGDFDVVQHMTIWNHVNFD